MDIYNRICVVRCCIFNRFYIWENTAENYQAKITRLVLLQFMVSYYRHCEENTAFFAVFDAAIQFFYIPGGMNCNMDFGLYDNGGYDGCY